MNLSVIIPIKDEQDNVRPLHEKLRAALDPTGRPYELLFVDDGSIDGSYHELAELAAHDPHVKVIRLRRNFGQTAALRAGIDWSCGEIIVTMDGDLQNDPADIPRLLKILDEGYDAVLGLRARRKDNLVIRKIPSLIGNWMIRKVTGVHIKDLGCTLRALRRDLAEALPLYGEMHRFIPVLAQQYGARMLQVEVQHHPRIAGKTKYNISKTFRVVLDLITVKFLHSYLTRPMHVMGMAGMASMLLGALCLSSTLWIKAHWGTWITGNPLLHLGIMLEFFGVQFLSLGLIGEVVTRTYFESQGKRAYVVRNTLNIAKRDDDRQAA
jgi:glycosyltransferase involved in cell wall biosynthesis